MVQTSNSKTILVVEARYYDKVSDDMVAGATPLFEETGFAIERLPVTGVFEVPAACEASRALMEITVDHCFPLGFAILTCENMQQAEVRADPKQKNKGAEAARAVLRMIELRRYFQGRDNA